MGDNLWDVSFFALIYLMTKSPEYASIAVSIKYGLMSTSPVVFRTLYRTRPLLSAYRQVVFMQIGLVLAAAAAVLLSRIAGFGVFLWVGVGAASLVYFLGQFLENKITTRVAKALSRDGSDHDALLKEISIQTARASAVAYMLGFGLLIPLTIWMPFGSTAAIGAVLLVATANIATFLVELRLAGRAFPKLNLGGLSDDEGVSLGSFTASVRIISSRAWFAIFAAAFVWFTILYPGAALITAVAKFAPRGHSNAGSDALAEVALTPFADGQFAILVGTLLSAAGFEAYRRGAATAKRRRWEHMWPMLFFQCGFLAMACGSLVSGGWSGILGFFILIICSRFGLGASYALYDPILAGEARRASQKHGYSQEQAHEQMRAWGLCIHCLCQMAVYAGFALLQDGWLKVPLNPLIVACVVSTISVFIGGVLWCFGPTAASESTMNLVSESGP